MFFEYVLEYETKSRISAWENFANKSQKYSTETAIIIIRKLSKTGTSQI